LTAAPPSPEFQLWQPPDTGADHSPARSRRKLAGWLIGVTVLVLAAIATLALAARSSTNHERVLPRTTAEASAPEDPSLTVEAGTTPDNRAFTIDVSVTADGDYCDFVVLELSTGGGCGPGSPMTYSFDDDGVLHGITDARIASIEVVTSRGRTTVATKPLPAQFHGHRHFVALLPRYVEPDQVLGLDRDGHVVARRSTFGD
jgi:hypothetical protein